MNSTYSNKKFIIDTNQAPRAIGPYSQGVTFGGLLFVSGQIPVDPQSGEIIAGGVEAQTRQVMNNLQAVLMAAGLDFSHVLKTTVFLRNMNDYQMMNDVYGLYFDYSPPARACVEVSRLPKDVLVEIECVAAAPTDYESRITESLDTGGDHPTPDQWEADHIAEANAAHAGIVPAALAADEQEPSDDDTTGIAEELAAARADEPAPEIAPEEQLDALDALDALHEGDGESDDQLDAPDADDDVKEPVEELDESEVIETDDDGDPLDIPSIPKLPASKSRPAPPRLATLKLSKTKKTDEDDE